MYTNTERFMDDVVSATDGFDSESDFFDYPGQDNFDGNELIAENYDNQALQMPDEFLGGLFKRKKKKRLMLGDIKQYRNQYARNLYERAKAAQLSPETVALNDVERNRGIVNQYVERNGQVPQQNPAALALQTANIYQQKIADKQKNGVPDVDVAEDAVIQDEQNEDWDEADNFLGGIIGGIFKAGKALINKINKKRKDKGKDELFKGEAWQQIGKQIEAGQQPLTDKLNELERKFLEKTNQELKKAQDQQSVGGAFASGTMSAIKKEAIMKYLPWVLIGIVVIVLVARKFK